MALFGADKIAHQYTKANSAGQRRSAALDASHLHHLQRFLYAAGMDDTSRLPASGESNAVPPAPVPGGDASASAISGPVAGNPGTLAAAPTAFPPMPERMLDEYDLGMPRRRRGVPLVLFLATCFFTYAAGTYHWAPTAFGMQFDENSPQRGEFWDLAGTLRQLAANWRDGLTYSACVMA